MLKLGHIIYSNCFPVHAGILTKKVPFPFPLVPGIPTELNRALVEGKVDVSPSSSIEYATNPGKYRILSDLSITSRSKVMSILLESQFPIAELNNRTVALTTASATSVVLLRIILELFQGVTPDYMLYEQGVEDPYEQADAVLTIGDLALKRSREPRFAHASDLGALWHEQTGLPFVFALWQVNYRKGMDGDLRRLHTAILESKKYGMARLRELAEGHAGEFGIPADVLFAYWNCFSYDFGPEEQKGLMAYYGYAAELGAIDAVPDLHFFGGTP